MREQMQGDLFSEADAKRQVKELRTCAYRNSATSHVRRATSPGKILPPQEANRWPANPRQHTTSGLECSRGQQRTERKRAKSPPGTATSGGACSRGHGRKPRQHRGNGQKKSQPVRVGISHDGGGTRNRTRVRHLNSSPSASLQSRIWIIWPFPWTFVRTGTTTESRF